MRVGIVLGCMALGKELGKHTKNRVDIAIEAYKKDVIDSILVSDKR